MKLLSAAMLLSFAPTVYAATLLETAAARKDAGEGISVTGTDNWLFTRSELHHLAAGPFWGEHADTANPATTAGRRDPMAAITNFEQRLREQNIDLLLVPIPAKSVVYPEKLDASLPAPTPRPDPHHQEFYTQLRKAGVNVLDVTDALIADRDDEPVYCSTDSHFSPKGAAIVAKAIAETVKTNTWFNGPATSPYKADSRQIAFVGDLAPDSGITPEQRQTTFITTATGASVPDDNADSPVLLLTDSHGLVFHIGGDEMHATQAGLVDLLAHELGQPIDLLGKRGSAATPVRMDLYHKAKGDPEWLQKKRLAVWVFTVREFTSSSWSTKIPVTRR